MPLEVNGYRVLEKFVKQYKTQKEAAAALEITEPYLTDLLHMRRELSAKMLAKLNLKRVVVVDK